MPAVIGIRIYRLHVHKRGSRSLLDFDSGDLLRHPKDFIEYSFKKHASIVQNDAAERSWYIEKKENTDNDLQAYIRYGTFGFESNLVDTETKKSNYRRKVTDVEEIPLFVRFWFPKKGKFVLVAFQSFQGRSCIGLLNSKLKEEFEIENRDHLLSISKLMPVNLKGSAIYSAPIKRVRFISKNTSSDLADRYLSDVRHESLDIEYSLSARRRKTLGTLKNLIGKMPDEKNGVLEYEGMTFQEAYAEVKVGNRLRRIGVFGSNSDAGVIDISDSINKGSDGHPTLDSLQRETKIILDDFYTALTRGS